MILRKAFLPDKAIAVYLETNCHQPNFSQQEDRADARGVPLEKKKE